MAIIWNQLELQQLNDKAIADLLLLQRRLAPTPTNKGYRKNQVRFLTWTQLNAVPYTTFSSGKDLANFLAGTKHCYQFHQVSTHKTMRAAVYNLHDDGPHRMGADD